MRAWLAVLLLAIGTPAGAATRVISLSPSLSEMVVELGAADLLVGRLEAGEPLPQLRSVPSVGRYGQLVMERRMHSSSLASGPISREIIPLVTPMMRWPMRWLIISSPPLGPSPACSRA